jgi:predicted  nucleic acid-binding Zn-ribbon protein
MKDQRALQERINLLEKEIQSLTTELQRLDTIVSRLDDMQYEMKGLKVFLARVHPDFRNQLPEIVRKLKSEKNA